MGQVFGVLSFYSTCNCWYFISFLKTCTNHCRSTIINVFDSNHVVGILRIDVTSFHILSFFVIATFIRSLETVPRQNIPLSKSFSNNVGKLKSCQNKAYSVCFLISLTNPKQLFPLAQALFFPFCQEKDQTHTDILFCFSIDTTTWNLICISCTAYKT